MGEAWTGERLDDLNRHVEEGFRRVDAGFERIDKRFESMEERFDKRFNSLPGRRCVMVVQWPS